MHSTKAVGAVAYLKLTAADGHSDMGFLLGKARLAPKPDSTIPRLELCAAVHVHLWRKKVLHNLKVELFTEISTDFQTVWFVKNVTHVAMTQDTWIF